MHDVLVLGGGGAGLTAGYRLARAGCSVAIVEKEARVSGRTRSGTYGDHSFNTGTQFFLGNAGALAELRKELAIPVRELDTFPVAVAAKGTLVEGDAGWKLLARLPYSLPAKFSLATTLLRFNRRAARLLTPHWAAANRARIEAWEQQPYAHLLERVHPEVRPFFETLAGDFCGNSPDVVSAVGGMISTLAITPDFGPRLVGTAGNESLPQALAAASGADVLTGTRVTSVENREGGVAVTVDAEAGQRTLEARYVICALPADIVPTIIPDLAMDKREALANVLYGPLISSLFLTNETDDEHWHRVAIMSVFDKSFSLVINQSRRSGGGRADGQRGSAIAALSATANARRLLDLSDEDAKAVVTHDMLELFPRMEKHLEAVVVTKWARGIPCLKPGSYRQSAARRAPHGRIYFAGDYITEATANLRSAVESGERAAADVLAALRETEFQADTTAGEGPA